MITLYVITLYVITLYVITLYVITLYIHDNIIHDKIIRDNIIRDNIIRDNIIHDNIIRDHIFWIFSLLYFKPEVLFSLLCYSFEQWSSFCIEEKIIFNYPNQLNRWFFNQYFLVLPQWHNPCSYTLFSVTCVFYIEE